MEQENDSTYFFTVKYKDGNLVCDAGRADFDSPERREVDKRMRLTNTALDIIRSHYPNATNIYIEVTSDDSKNTLGFVNDGIPINVIWRIWDDNWYLVYLSTIDKVTKKFFQVYTVHDVPEIEGYPYKMVIPRSTVMVLNEIEKSGEIIWHALTNNN